MRARGHMRPYWRRLLPRHTAADGLQFEASILRGFQRSPYGLAYEGRHFNSALLDVQDHGSTRRRFLLACSIGSAWIFCWHGLAGRSRQRLTLPHRRLHYVSVAAARRGQSLPWASRRERPRRTILVPCGM